MIGGVYFIICIIVIIASIVILLADKNQKPKVKKEISISEKKDAPVPDPKPVQEPSQQLVMEKIKVAGVTHYQETFEKLAKPNPIYEDSRKELIDAGIFGDRVYEYNYPYNNIELIPEPTNEHDPNAIAVMVDGLKIGYVKAGSCGHIKKLLKNNKIKKINAEIGNGKYKIIVGDDERLVEDKTLPFIHLELWKEA